MFWLGASDDDIEGIWKWVATDEELNFENWDVSNNQPSSIHDNHEDCLVIKGEYDFMWHDVECDAEHGFPLCEMQGTSTGGTNPLSAIG
ncbi:perlucin-like [Mya arenaria]|nr:perlucin-like [Mya arenaria]